MCSTSNHQISERSTFESDVYQDSLSNHTQSRTTAHELSLYFNYDSKRWQVNAGILMKPERRSLDHKTGLLYADTIRTSINWNPQFDASWRKGKTRFEFSYSGNTQLSFYWSDVLSDKKNYYRNVTATGLTERRTSQIGSYFIITFRYRLNKQP